MTARGVPLSTQDMQTTTPTQKAWHERPGVCLAVGIALAVVCALSLVMWISTTVYAVRAVGLASGAGAFYFIYGGLTGLKESRS